MLTMEIILENNKQCQKCNYDMNKLLSSSWSSFPFNTLISLPYDLTISVVHLTSSRGAASKYSPFLFQNLSSHYVVGHRVVQPMHL